MKKLINRVLNTKLVKLFTLKRGEAVSFFPEHLTLGFACRRSSDGLWCDAEGKLIGFFKVNFRRKRRKNWGVYIIIGERSYAFGWTRPIVRQKIAGMPGWYEVVG